MPARRHTPEPLDVIAANKGLGLISLSNKSENNDHTYHSFKTESQGFFIARYSQLSWYFFSLDPACKLYLRFCF